MSGFVAFITLFYRTYITSRMLAISTLGFASGLPLALTVSVITVWLAREGVDKASIGLFALVGLPYVVKFLWAPFIDHLKIPFLHSLLGRRRSWLWCIELLLALSLVFLGLTDPVSSLTMVALAALVVSFLSASHDVVIDAYRVELLDDDSQGAGVAMFVGGYRIGMLASGGGALILSGSGWEWSMIYSFMACILLVGIVASLILREPVDLKDLHIKEEDPSPAGMGDWFLHAVLAPFTEFATRRSWWLILIFILLYKFGDALSGAMTNVFLVDLKFTDTQIGVVLKTYGTAATFIGIFLGGALIKRFHILHALLICGVAQMLSNLIFIAQYYVGNSVEMLMLTVTIENMTGGMGTAAFIAYLAILCNKEFTATQYALLSALATAGRTILSASSGVMVEQFDWVGFYLISTLVALPGIVLIRYLKLQEDEKPSDAKSKSDAIL